MATSKKFSELPAASSVGNGDLFAIAHEDALAETGYVSQKLTAAQAGQKVNGDTEYPTSLPSFPENGQNPFAALEKLNADIEALYPVNTASGSTANFTTSLAKPLTALSSTIVAQQASGTPTPSSPLPISGFSSVSFYQRGVNLWDEETEIGNIDNATGEDIWSSGILRIKGYIRVKPNTSYYFKAPTETSKNLTVFFYDENKNFISLTYKQNSTGTTPQNAHYMRFKISSAYGTTYGNDISINYPSTDTSYHAYNANSDTFTISLGQTVYGGNIDAKSGKATITHAICDFGDFTWTRWTSGSDALFYNSVSDKVNDRDNYLLCSCFSVVHNSATGLDNANGLLTSDNSIIASKNTSQPRLMVRCNSYTTADDFKTAFTGQKVVFELATPIEIDITANNFTTISGEQNIFSDCGEVTVGFKQGIQEYIDAQIAATQALIL